ncbi:MAG: Holliday junction resolvase RuvX [Bacillota bacterium]
MALDVGETRIGVALSDPLGLTAQGLEVIRRKNPEDDLKAVAKLASLHGATTVVVGLPRNMNGSSGPSATKAMEFASMARERTGLEVVTVDERLTTRQAERLLISADLSRRKRRMVVDKMAACLILQSYLDQRARKTPGPAR